MISVCDWYPPMAWYRGDMVVGWCSTRISASNSHVACGLSLGETITMPFLMDDRFICAVNKNRQINKDAHAQFKPAQLEWDSYDYWQLLYMVFSLKWF